MPSKKDQSAIESNTAFMVKIEDLVREIVIQNEILYYRIESQMEHHAQLDGDDSYVPVIRIITYFEDTVGQISDLVRSEFNVFTERSVDKKKIRLDSFSYKHVQFIVGLTDNRRELTEYRRSGNKRIEIHLCSMLQDAWAGIEKELGYNGDSFPDDAKRDFYRVGALLEMADIEFLKIRGQLSRQPEVLSARTHQTIVNDHKEIAVETNVDTFTGHLSSVAGELPVEQVMPQPEIILNALPPQLQPQAIFPQVAYMHGNGVHAAIPPIPQHPYIPPVVVHQVVSAAPVQPVPVATPVAAPQHINPIPPSQAFTPPVAVQPKPATNVTPLQQPQAIVSTVSSQPVANTVLGVQPAPIQATPAQPQTVVSAAPLPQPQPILQPVAIIHTEPVVEIAEAPVAAQTTHAATEASAKPAHFSILQSIVPKRVPQAPKGLAPQRIKAPTINEIESMDLNVTSVALNITNIENKNPGNKAPESKAPESNTVSENKAQETFVPEHKHTVSEQHLSQIVNHMGSLVDHAITAAPTPAGHPEDHAKMHMHAAVENSAPVTSAHHQHAGREEVELNIENVHNFNMTVNEIIEKTEIIREPEEKAPVFFEDVPAKPTKPEPLDENAHMTDASLKEYVLNSKLVKEVDGKIAERAGAKINPDIDIEGDVERLRFLKVFTLKQLHDRITDNKNDIVSFAEKWIGKDNGGSFDSGICLFYLEYLLVGKKNDPAFAIEYVVKFISDNDYSARYIIPTYNSIRNTETSNFSHLTLKA